jgi:hypothetical protein
MRTLLRITIVMFLLQACSSGRNAQKGIYSYTVTRYFIEDAREYDEYPDISCQLDFCNMEEFTNELQGLPRFKRRKSEIENSLLTTSFNDVMRTEIEHTAEMDIDKTPLTCRIKITCIGLTTDGCLMTSVTGKLFSRDGSLFAEGRGSGLILISDQNQDIDWNNQITHSIRNAVNDCVKRMLRRM